MRRCRLEVVISGKHYAVECPNKGQNYELHDATTADVYWVNHLEVSMIVSMLCVSFDTNFTHYEVSFK